MTNMHEKYFLFIVLIFHVNIIIIHLTRSNVIFNTTSIK